jgi:hypothetical protein
MAAFVRVHSHERWLPLGQDEHRDDTPVPPRPDVQAALDVIGRRYARRDGGGST